MPASLHPSLPAKPTFAPAPSTSATATSTSTRSRRKAEKKRADGQLCTPWIEGLPMTKYSSADQRLHDEVVAFVQFATPNAAERAARDKLIACLTAIVQRRFWSSDVKVFGSVAQDLSLLSGDVDIVIQTPLASGDENRKRGLFQLSRMLRDSGFADKTFVVTNARVPILTFETVPELGDMKVDLSINSTDGVTVLPKIKQYLDTMPALCPIIMTVKMFLAVRDLNSAATGGLGSYALTLMAISFLHLRPCSLPAGDYNDPMVEGSLGRLLMGFLDYYHDKFPYDTSYISVLQGNLGLKSSKGWIRENHEDALSIESIINSDADVGKACQKIRQIRAAFGDAHAMLKAYKVNEVIKDDSGHERTIWHSNVLGSILGIPRSALEHRKNLEDLVASGQLDAHLAGIVLPDSWGLPPPRPQDMYRRHEGSGSSAGGGYYRKEPGERHHHRDRRDDDRRDSGSRRDPPHRRTYPHGHDHHDNRYQPYRPRGPACPW